MRTFYRATMLVGMLVTATVSYAAPAARAAGDQTVQTANADAGRPARPEAPEAADATPRKVLDKKFWVVGAALGTAMFLDTKSTFDVVKWCADCREANPVAAPFIRQGPATTYAAAVAFDVGVMAIAGKMKGSEKAWARHTWWVIPVALATGHTIAYRHNVNLK